MKEERIEESKPLKKAFAALRDMGAEAAAQVISNTINQMVK